MGPPSCSRRSPTSASRRPMVKQGLAPPTSHVSSLSSAPSSSWSTSSPSAAIVPRAISAASPVGAVASGPSTAPRAASQPGGGKAAGPRPDGRRPQALGAPGEVDAMAQPCRRCARPAFLYGCRDVDTGWEGWCRICCWHWHYRVPNALQRRRLLTPVPEPAHTLVITFLAGDAVGQAWGSGEARRALAWAAARAVREVWWRTLLGAFQDELEDGVVDPALNFTNPLWKLQLAYGGSFNDDRGRPLVIVMSMLGLPSYRSAAT